MKQSRAKGVGTMIFGRPKNRLPAFSGNNKRA
jgi:hypothetical protein